jgi:hypothetical protein
MPDCDAIHSAEAPKGGEAAAKLEARDPKEIESRKCRCYKPLVGVREFPFSFIGIRFGFRASDFLPEQRQIAG